MNHTAQVLVRNKLCLYSGCEDFVINQIAPTIQKPGIKDIIELRMIPYGNARETQESGKYVFQCQHGPKVC
jgi:hypothetical protein